MLTIPAALSRAASLGIPALRLQTALALLTLFCLPAANPKAQGQQPPPLLPPQGQPLPESLTTTLSAEPIGAGLAPESVPLANLAEQMDRASAANLPMAEQHRHWYQSYPWLWIPLDGWTNSVEFGLNGTEGNSQTTSIQTGADLERSTKRYTFAIDLDYQRTQSGNLETQNNGRLNIDYDRLLGDTQWSAFGKLGLEYDEFKAFDLRLNLNAGAGYYWVRTDDATLVTRFGAGASKEIGGPDDSWVPEALFGFEASQQLTERQKIRGKLDYFPQWDAFSDYRLVSDVSWEILLDGVDNLSLKLAATNRYDSTPQGLEPHDLFYSALLLWKF